MDHARLLLKPGRDKSLLRKHPWVFSGSVERVEGNPGVGDTLEVLSAQRQFLGWAAFSPHSQILARVWSFERAVSIGPELIRARIEKAIALRTAFGLPESEGGARLVHAESDGLPGLVVDRFDRQLVLQINSAGALAWRDSIVDALQTLTGIDNVHERSDSEVLEQEGIAPSNATLRGTEVSRPVPFNEHGLSILADVREGHKTGFYLDQRDNRALLRSQTRDRDVLDCFCYTGGFTLNAMAGGARSVTAIDASQSALDMASGTLLRNGFDLNKVNLVCGDVFQTLRRYRDGAKAFDIIVLDPPKFAPRASFAERAARGYKDINLLAFKLLRPGGMLFTYSCSGGISPDLFQKIVAGAALDANVDAKIVRKLGAAPDHPVALHFPEGEYLKGLVCTVG